jgi:6-phospho-beta-glucosidase
VIEVPTQVNAQGATPLPLAELSGPIDPLFAGLIAHTAGYEELALEAALHGGRDRVFKAMLVHPLIGQIEQAERLTDNLLAENRDYLTWT